METSEMSTVEQTGGEFEMQKDTSVSEAKWMLACVIFLAVAVLAVGFVAEMTIAAPKV